MGQLALGLRSLIIKFGVFFVLAAALAWALGGTLFPQRFAMPPCEFDGKQWWWEVDRSYSDESQVVWRIMHAAVDEEPVVGEGLWKHPAGPVVAADAMAFGGLVDGQWRIVRVESGEFIAETLPSVLTLHQRLAEMGSGGSPDAMRPGDDEPDAPADADSDAER